MFLCTASSTNTIFSFNIIAYKGTGSLAMQNFSVGFGQASELTAVIIFMTLIIMGLLIPEYYYCVITFENIPISSLTGMYLVIVSIICPMEYCLSFNHYFKTYIED